MVTRFINSELLWNRTGLKKKKNIVQLIPLAPYSFSVSQVSVRPSVFILFFIGLFLNIAHSFSANAVILFLLLPLLKVESEVSKIFISLRVSTVSKISFMNRVDPTAVGT